MHGSLLDPDEPLGNNSFQPYAVSSQNIFRHPTVTQVAKSSRLRMLAGFTRRYTYITQLGEIFL